MAGIRRQRIRNRMADYKMKQKNCQELKLMKIVFMGTPEFGAMILEGLCKANLKPVLVITAPDKPVGRKQIITPPPVKIMAQQYRISVVLQPAKILDSRFQILDSKPELIVVAAYGEILPQEILTIPKYGCLNIHPSLLPKYRGATPVQSAILNGDKETGLTIILMDEQIDHGPILSQKKTIIGPNETTSQLHDRLALMGSELLIDAIPDWIREKIKLRPQDDKKATYTKILTKKDGEINWTRPAQEIERQIRAFCPWPGAYTFWEREAVKIKNFKKTKVRKKILLKILEARLQNHKLIIEKVQAEGKKPMNFKDFLRGNQDFLENKTICPVINLPRDI